MKQPKSLVKQMTPEEIELEKKRAELSTLEGELVQKEYTSPTLGVKFVLIPAGTFMMGSPGDEHHERHDNEVQHIVTISQPFYMQITEVTQRQWQQMMGNNPSEFIFKGKDCPVDQVSWNDVQNFIGRLNRQEGANKYRLPTEAEWEYACRGGSTTAYCFGDDPDRLGKYAWYYDNSWTSPVGKKKPNSWGLYDMHGNVYEWCQDWYGDYPWSSTDPEGPSSGTARVIRGGSWGCDEGYCRSAYRDSYDPACCSSDLGFRLVRTVDPDRREPEQGERTAAEKMKPIREDKQTALSKQQLMDTSPDRNFITYGNGTVLDTRTNLMWAAKDNEYDIDWADAAFYCENYRGGSYTDWRMPTLAELEELYESENYKSVIQINSLFVWASETREPEIADINFNDDALDYKDDADECGDDPCPEAVNVNFNDGTRYWNSPLDSFHFRALPVRSGK